MKAVNRLIFSKVVVFFGLVTARMRERVKLRGVIAASVLLGLLGVAGCATAPASESDVQKLVAERATARWRAMIKVDLDAAYEFLSPGSKETTARDVFKAKIKASIWRDVEVQSVKCADQICKVVLLITYDYKNMKGIKTQLNESWLLDKGTAWYIYRG